MKNDSPGVTKPATNSSQNTASSAGISDSDWTGMLLEACRLVGKSSGTKISEPVNPLSRDDPLEAINDISHVSGFFPQQVLLIGDWSRRDSGSLVGFLGRERVPVALIRGSRGYQWIDTRNSTARGS